MQLNAPRIVGSFDAAFTWQFLEAGIAIRTNPSWGDVWQPFCDLSPQNP